MWNLTGATGDDTFTFLPGGSVSGTLTGGIGTNTIDYSAYTADVTVNLLTGAATGVGGGVNNRVVGVANVIGGSGNNTLTGNATANTFTLIAGAGTIDGGGGSDTYIVKFGALSAPVNIDDGGSTSDTDTLTIHGTTHGDDLDISTKSSSNWKPFGAAGDYQQHVIFSNVEKVTLDAGAGDDIQRDPSSASLTLLGGPGDDTIIIQDTTGLVTADGGDGSDRYIVNAGNLQGPVTISDSGTTGTDVVTVNGTPGNDTITQTETGIVANGETINLGSGLDGLTVDGGGGTGDTFTVVGTPTVAATVQGVSDAALSGTVGNDTIVLSPVGNSGTVSVKLNGKLVGTYTPTGRLRVYGLAGDDDLQISGAITAPLWLSGGDGNDRLNGGNGPNVLLGGAGNDLLLGGTGRDLMIGGAGADQLVGNGGDDLMIGGTTAFDADDPALKAVVAEWRSGHDFATRIANLSGNSSSSGFESRLNEDYFLIPLQTAFADGAIDILTGSSGSDWYIVDLADQVNGANNNDKVTRFGP
jgi:Ca2+-binding RTX toxin-like protein